ITNQESPQEHFIGNGYWAIGAGFWPFISEFMSARYDNSWPWWKAMLLMYSAKQRAESASGVSSFTDMFIIEAQHGFRLLQSDALEMIKGYYRETSEAARTKAAEIALRVRDNKLLATLVVQPE